MNQGCQLQSAAVSTISSRFGAKRLECAELANLAPAFERHRLIKSAGKPDAVQTLARAWRRR